MFGNNREDDLLNKLKTCIGSIKNQNPSFQDNRGSRPSYTAIKENYQSQGPAKMLGVPISNTKPTASENNYTRQALGSNYNPPIQPRRPSVNENNMTNLQAAKYDFETRSKNLGGNTYNNQFAYEPKRNQPSAKKFEYEKSEPGIRKFQYGVPNGRRNEVEDRPIEEIAMRRVHNMRQQMTETKQEPINSRPYEAKGQIARRYSVMQNEKIVNKYVPQEDGARKVATARNYQQQVEERRSLIENEMERRDRTPISARKDVITNTLRKEGPPITRELSSAQSHRQPYKLQPEDIPAPRPERQTLIKQTLHKSYEVKDPISSGTGECSALGKLRKISELNQKINERIRNIINVFEQHKC